LEPRRFARLDEPPDVADLRVEPEDAGVAAAAGLGAGVSSGVASTVEPSSFGFFFFVVLTS